MSREIKSHNDPNVSVTDVNSYKDRLLKLIPSEIIAAFITLHGLILGMKSTHEDQLIWIMIALLFILTPFYLYRISNVSKKGQIFFSSIGFLVWVFATNPPHIEIWDLKTEAVGALVLIVYTLFTPLFYKG